MLNLNHLFSAFFLFIFLFKSHFTQSISDCYDYNRNATFGCYIYPITCASNLTNCIYIVKWQDASSAVNFQLISNVQDSKVSLTSMYTAVGFSTDRNMGNDSVVMCRKSGNINEVESYYNNYDHNSDVLNSTDRKVGVTNANIATVNSFFMCNFTRAKSIAGNALFYNLSNPFYILTAYGRTNSLGSPIWHGANAEESKFPQNFSTLASADYVNMNLTTTTTITTTATTKFNSTSYSESNLAVLIASIFLAIFTKLV